MRKNLFAVLAGVALAATVLTAVADTSGFIVSRQGRNTAVVLAGSGSRVPTESGTYTAGDVPVLDVNGALTDAGGPPMLTNGHAVFGGSAPAVATGSSDCGTSPAIAGNDNVGRVTVGSSTNGGKCTITFATAWPHIPICSSYNETSPTARSVTYAATTTTLTITSTSTLTAADSLVYRCAGY